MKQVDWIYNMKYKDIRDIDITFIVNDKMDVCIRINKKSDLEYDEEGERLDRHLIERNCPDHK